MDELFGQLHLFDLAQKQLHQAIRGDASEADLRAHLDYTLLNITDGAKEEEGDFADFTFEEGMSGKATLGPESPDMLARGRVYEKALGEATLNTRLKEFLVMELEKDANLIHYLSLNKPAEVRRLKIASWAATCNFVHIVMALIHCKEGVDSGFLCRVLSIAVEFGYVELVKSLTEVKEVNVNEGGQLYDFDDIYLRAVGKPIPRTFGFAGRNVFMNCLYYYAFTDRLAPLNLAAKLGDVEMLNTLLACKRIDVKLARPLHWAVKMGHDEVVKAMLLNKEIQLQVNATLRMSVQKSLIVNRPSYVNFRYVVWWAGLKVDPLYLVNFTPLQLASLYGHASVVKILRDDSKECLVATIENDAGITALQIATERKNDVIMKILTDVREVEKQEKRLYRDRQVHVDAANAILVGAALIASVTFAGWLQPPLGYSPFSGNGSLDARSPTPSGMYPSFISVEDHPILKIFWVFNSLSFFFAIATLMVGATAARPPKKHTYIGVMVRSLRTSLQLAYALLTVSIACVMGAFASAGFVVLPPIHSYTTVMGATVGIGVMVVFVGWTFSTVLKVLFEVLTRIEDLVKYVNDHNNYSILKLVLFLVLLSLDRILNMNSTNRTAKNTSFYISMHHLILVPQKKRQVAIHKK